MKSTKMRPFALTAVASSMILAGCLGGGGGGGSSSSSGSVGVGGVAASGHLKNARVIVYCGKEEVSSKELGRGVTADGTAGTKPGAFSVAVSGACSEPLKIVIKPLETGGTKMINKLDGSDIDVPADSGLKLRKFVASKPTSSTTEEHVTPLSDMVAALAERQTSLTASTLSQANTAVANIFGGNQDLLTAEPKLDPTTPAEKQLYQLGAAVEKIAANDGGSLTAATLAAALTKVAEATKAAVTQGSNGSLTVAPTSDLTQEITTTISSLPSTVTDKTSGSTLDTSPVTIPVTAVDNSVATAITAAKALFATLKADVLALWNDAGTGFLNTKTAEMDADFKTIKSTEEDIVEYVSVMVNGATMVAEYDAAPADNKNIHGWSSGTDRDGTFLMTMFYPSAMTGHFGGCRIYTSGTYATSPTSARCSWTVSSSYDASTSTSTAQQQFIKVAAVSGQTGKFAWTNFPRTCTTTYTSTGVTSGCVKATGAVDLTGELGMTETSSTTSSQWSGSASASIKGKIQPIVVGAADTSLDMAVSGTMTEAADGNSGSFNISTMTGSVASGPAKISLLSGTQISANKTATAATGSFKLAMRAETSKFRYDGTLEASGTGTPDSNGLLSSATGDASFTGTASTLSSGTATAFFEGKIGGKASFTRDAATGATTQTVNSSTITGKVTNATKVYDVNYTATKDSTGISHSLTYTNPNAVKVTVAGKDTGASTDTLLISSGTTSVLMKRDSTGTIKANGITDSIGTVNKNKATFTDGTYVLFM